MPITDSWLKANHKRARDKVEEKSDGGGLSVRASATGRLVFQMRFRWEGKPVRLDLGTYPMTSLKDARSKHIAMKAVLAGGKDPRDVKKEEAQKVASMPTMQELFMSWYNDFCIKEKVSAPEILASFELHVFPVIGSLPADQVGLNIWMDLLDTLKERVPSIASRILMNAQQMYRWAGRREILPYHSLMNISARQDLRITKGTRGRALTEEEIRQWYRVLKSVNIYPTNKLFLRFCLMMGCRNSEAREMEPADIDFENKVWVLPPEKNKLVKVKLAKVEDVMPLKRPLLPEAMAIIEEAMEMAGLSSRVFAPAKGGDEIQSRTTLSFPTRMIQHSKRRYGVEMKHWSMHDLRKTARTNFSRFWDNPLVPEKMIGHKVKGTQGVYDYHDYLDEQAIIYRQWFDYLLSLQ